jgi:hypothetical protein
MTATPFPDETYDADDLPPTPLLRRLHHLDLYAEARVIAQRWHLTLEDMFESTRRPAPRARADFYRRLRGLRWSYHRIGELVGRDGSTVRAACLEIP